MAKFEISNQHSGLVLGVFEGATEQEALDAMARDAGYSDYAELKREVPAQPGEIIVREVTTDTYTVLRADGGIEGEGLTLAEAADTVMTYDGHTYSIRPAEDGAGYELWTSLHSRNSTAGAREVRSTIRSRKTDRAEAEAEIYRKVIDHADWWHSMDVMTDADYAAMLREIEAGA